MAGPMSSSRPKKEVANHGLSKEAAKDAPAEAPPAAASGPAGQAGPTGNGSAGGPPAGGAAGPAGGPPAGAPGAAGSAPGAPAGSEVTPLQPHPQYRDVSNVYSDNLDVSLAELAELDYDFLIGVESFFPGLVLRPTIPVDSFLEHHYATLRSNVDCKLSTTTRR